MTRNYACACGRNAKGSCPRCEVTVQPDDRQPRMIPNPLWCDRCEGRGYVVMDAEWEPYAVQCHDCKDRRPAREAGK